MITPQDFLSSSNSNCCDAKMTTWDVCTKCNEPCAPAEGENN